MIYNLHLLRAVAAAMVVVHHARDGLTPAFPDAGQVVVGAAGVDLFFVLSGVVITLAERERVGAPGAFALRRAIRVVPMYWLALAVVGLMLVAGFSPVGVQATDATITNMLRSMFFVPFERAHGAVMPLLGLGWTLNYEAFFYAIFASLMFVHPNQRPATLIAVMVTLVGLGTVLHPPGVAWAFYTNPILLEFAAGVGLAHLWTRFRHPSQADVILGAGLLGVGVALLLWNANFEAFEQLMPARVLVFGVPATFCVAGAMLLERGGCFARGPLVMLLGAASFMLYLFHVIVLQCLDVVCRAIGIPLNTAEAVIGMAVAGFLLSHLVAILIHLRIEIPLTALLRGAKPKRYPA